MSSEHNRPPTRGQALLFAGGFEGGLLILWLFLGWLLGRPPSAQGAATAEAILYGVLATLPLLPALLWASRSPWAPLRDIMRKVDEILVPFLGELSVPDLAVVALLAGAGEEGLFRGLLQGGLAGEISPLLALLVSSAAFGLLHFITPAYAVLATILGLYLGMLYHFTGNVVIPMVVHGLYDFIALVYLVRWRRR